jgi:hypothetical protein
LGSSVAEDIRDKKRIPEDMPKSISNPTRNNKVRSDTKKENTRKQ